MRRGGGPEVAVGRLPQEYAVLLSDAAASVQGVTFRGDESPLVAIGGTPVVEGVAFESVGIATRSNLARVTSPSLIIEDSAAARVAGNEFSDGGPISIEDACVEIEDNVLRDAGIVGRFRDDSVIRGNSVSGAPGAAVELSTVTNALVKQNEISESGVGVRAGQAGLGETFSPIIRGNTISGVEEGITVPCGAAWQVADNVIAATGTAISTSESTAQSGASAKGK